MKLRINESQLERLKLLIEGDMDNYFPMVKKVLDDYIKFLNNLYNKFGDITILDLLDNTNSYNDLKHLEGVYNSRVDYVYKFMSDYESKTEDIPDYKKYYDEMKEIRNKELIFRDKESLIEKVIDGMHKLIDIRDEFDKNPFSDNKPIDLG